MTAPAVHPTAIVEAGAQVGAGTRLWHHVHVRSGASLGRDCTLGKNVYVDVDVVIGDRVKLQNNVSVYAGVELADDVFVGPNVVFTNDRVPRATSSWEVTPTRVGPGASIGANATVVAGCHIGESAMVGAGAVVTRPVRDHGLVVGNPARLVAWVCRCGSVRVKRETASELDCHRCGTRFAIPPGE